MKIISLLLITCMFKRYAANASIKCNRELSVGSLDSVSFNTTKQVVTQLFELESSQQLEFLSVETTTSKLGLLTSKAMNPFMYAVHLAYAEHLVLELTPDMIWYLIVDAVATYVRENSELMRHIFVDFRGRKAVTITTDTDFDWKDVIRDLDQLLTNNTKRSMDSDPFTAHFTTSSIQSLTAIRISRMDAMQKYFKYLVRTLCGIPEIRLLGERADWLLLKDKVDGLVSLVDAWPVWRQNLHQILQKFVDVFDGHVDVEFWNDIYKVGGLFGSGNPFITGWVTNFFPYLSSQRLNEQALKWDWKRTRAEPFTTNDFNARMSTAAFDWYRQGNRADMVFFGGLVGVGYDAGERAVKPLFAYGLYSK